MRKNYGACEICGEMTFLDTHHIQSRSKGGNNKPYNKVKICPNCHRKVHKGSIHIEGWFFTTLGNKLIWRLADEAPITDSSPEVHII